MTGRLISADNALTTLGSSLTSTATSLTVASGAGALFPNPTGGQYFLLTLFAAGSATGLPNEIVQVTARTGDSMTIVRGQEGTSPANWNVGDQASNQFTSGSMLTFAQQVDVQTQTGNYAVDSGTANAGAVTLTPAPTALSQLVGWPIRVLKEANANTGPYTLNVNALGPQPVTLAGAALVAGVLAASQVFVVQWDGTSLELMTPSATALGGPPTGAAAGVLAGTYPNPGFAEVAQNATEPLLLGVVAGSGDVTPTFQTPATLVLPGGQTAQFRNQQTSGTASGETLSATTWNTRALNTTAANTIAGASLGSNQITLPAGTYAVSAQAVAETGTTGTAITHKLRLRDATAGATLVSGINSWVNSISTAQGSVAFLQGLFTLAAAHAVELDSWVSSGCNGGPADSTGEAEVYVDVYITRLS